MKKESCVPFFLSPLSLRTMKKTAVGDCGGRREEKFLGRERERDDGKVNYREMCSVDVVFEFWGVKLSCTLTFPSLTTPKSFTLCCACFQRDFKLFSM